jgi:para-nitrobenzyl esterase
MLAAVFYVSALLAMASVGSAQLPPPPQIMTNCGDVIGVDVSTPDGAIVRQYRSIPFTGGPPARWQPPRSGCRWSGVWNATAFRDVCIQPDASGSEDCLYLDVHVPEKISSGAPVLFYIHGGGLMTGAGQWEYVDVLATRLGVIVVTIQYRLNALGWLCVEGMSSCNFGLLDQQAALRWTRDNIAAFGGDPTRVTLAGQSSGGTSIFALLASPASRGLFAGALSMSGSANISISLQSAQRQNAGFAGAAGCAPPGSSPAQRLECLRRAPASTITAAIPPSWNTPDMWGLEDMTPAGRSFAGLPVVDGSVLTHSFQGALAAGLVDVPLIIGSQVRWCQ